MSIPIACNVRVTLASVSCKEGTTRSGKWSALDFLFEYLGRYHSEKVFGPRDSEERIKVSKMLRHISDVIGIDYENIEYQSSFAEFARHYASLTKPMWGTQIYGKFVPRVDNSKDIPKIYPRLGYDLPVLSLNSDLSYTAEEEAAIEAANAKISDYGSNDAAVNRLGDVPF